MAEDRAGLQAKLDELFAKLEQLKVDWQKNKYTKKEYDRLTKQYEGDIADIRQRAGMIDYNAADEREIARLKALPVLSKSEKEWLDELEGRYASNNPNVDSEFNLIKTGETAGTTGADTSATDWTPELESELSQYITDTYGKKYVKGMLEAAKTSLDAPYSAIQIYATNNQINPQETSNVKAIYEDFWVGTDESGNPVRHEWGESVEGLTSSEQLAIDKFNEEKRQNELYWADKNTTNKREANLDWRNYWGEQATNTATQRQQTVKDYGDFLNTNEQLAQQRQIQLAQLTPRQWLNATSLTGESPKMDWLGLLGVSPQQQNAMNEQAAAWEQEQDEVRAQKATDLAEYYQAMADYTVAASKREAYERKVAAQADWATQWQGTPNEKYLSEIMGREDAAGPEMEAPIIPMRNTPAESIPNPWANIIKNANIGRAGPETYYNQFNDEQQQNYMGLLEAKGYNAQNQTAKDWAGVHYGPIRRTRTAY
ncbi:MAG: hypothetical protein PHV74_11875 [Dehalococcoidia bacterium]|nr:hypothetical protein [Dehalococcoidia bacterium]